MHRLFLLLIFLIPYQRRFYRPLKEFSLSLIPADFPAYFEIHLDWFITDFIVVFLFLWALRTTIEWRSFLWDGERKFLTLFLLMALVSIGASPYGSYALHYWRWAHLALPALLFYLASRTVVNFASVAKVVLASSLLQCAIAIPQYFMQHSLGLRWLGEQTLISRHALGAAFPMNDGSVSIFDRLLGWVHSHAYVIRAYGTLPHPNILGGFMVFGIVMTYYLYGLGKKRGWLGLAIGLQVFSLVITYSRAALYAWACATILWLVLDFWKEKKMSSLVWVAGGSFALCLVCFYPQLFERGGVVSYNAVTLNSDLGRLTLNDVGIAMLKTHPFLGVGFNNYMLAFQELSQGLLPMFVHNAYLLLGAEIGIFGLLAFLTFCFMVLKKGWERRQLPEIRTSLVLFAAFLGIGLVDYYPLYSQQFRLIFFLTAAFLLINQDETVEVVHA